MQSGEVTVPHAACIFLNFLSWIHSSHAVTMEASKSDAGIDSWKMPNFYTIDLGLSYRFDLCKGLKAVIYSNVYNLTNTCYVADATDGATHDWDSALVFYGFGRTWSTGFKVMF